MNFSMKDYLVCSDETVEEKIFFFKFVVHVHGKFQSIEYNFLYTSIKSYDYLQDLKTEWSLIIHEVDATSNPELKHKNLKIKQKLSSFGIFYIVRACNKTLPIFSRDTIFVINVYRFLVTI